MNAQAADSAGATGPGPDPRAGQSGARETLARAALQLGNARAESGDVAGARAAYQQAIDTGHPRGAPLAAVNLGIMLRRVGDMSGAEAAYRVAVGFGYPRVAAKAAHNLGILLTERGDADAARAAYRQAIDIRGPQTYPRPDAMDGPRAQFRRKP